MSTHQSISCPKCGAGYQIRADLAGKLKCKKCSTIMQVGVSQAGKRGTQARDNSDQRMAMRLMLVAGVVVVLLMIIIAVAGNTDSGTAAPSDDQNVAALYEESPEARAAREARTAQFIADTKEKRKIAKSVGRSFLEAVAEGDELALREHFLIARNFERRAGGPTGAAKKVPDYAAATEEERAELDQSVLEALLDATHGVYVKTQLLPLLDEKEGAALIELDIEGYPWRMTYRSPDEDGNPLFKLGLTLETRPGIDHELEWAAAQNWAVVAMSMQWLQQIGEEDGPKRQKRLTDVVSTAERRARRKRVKEAGGTGFPEAEPRTLPPVAGTGERQTANVRGYISTLVSGGGREVNVARDSLVSMGKIAIPFLLNELVHRDHGSNEEDILTSFTVIQTLRRITGELEFGYAPGRARMMGMSMATATDEERKRAVRRWFGWWKENARTFTGPKALPSEEDGGD